MTELNQNQHGVSYRDSNYLIQVRNLGIFQLPYVFFSMACNVMNSWTFTGLVGAFLDLSIAYLFLCGSTLAYFASKFLGFFGLSLPCPCNGLFRYMEKKNCFQAMLVHDPSLKISSVQYSIMKRLPFDSIWNNFYDDEEDGDDEHYDSQSNSDYWQNGKEEMEGEASSWNGKKNFIGAKKGSFGPIPKWKGRPRAGLRQRKRNASDHRGKVLSFPYDPLVSVTTSTGFNSSATFGKLGNDVIEDGTTSLNSEDGRETAKEIGWPKQGFQMDYESFAENKSIEKELAMAKFKCLTSDKDFDGSDKNTNRVLGRALDEEHSTCVTLYIELEKERMAAATAADEAMAMILRLQEEKATIEMEARQYRRMIEAKSAYDAEEMNILKEILLRRETEKYFLEKEVESCKRMFYGKEQLDADMYDIASTQEQEMSSEEQEPLRIQQVSESFRQKEKTKINIDFGEEIPIAERKEAAGFLNSSIAKYDAHLFQSVDEINQESKENGVASNNKNLNHQERHVLYEKAIDAMVEEEEQCSETNPDQRLTPKTTEAKLIFPYNNEKMEKHGRDLHGSGSGFDCHVLDVHVINDVSNVNNKEGEERIEKKSVGVTSNAPKTCDNQTIGGLEIEPCRKRNGLDRSEGLPPIGPSQAKSLHRKSMSAFDCERLKIDNEVAWLRERIKIVQLGREKLNFPAGHREREQVELQVLEDIASQL